MASLQCIYLGLDRPAVELAAEYLLQRWSRGGMADLTEVTLALPTQRAGRRLREVLLEQAAQRGIGIFPPSILTDGTLPELLYEQKKPFATPLLQQFAWSRALQEAPRRTIDRILPQAPSSPADPRWLELAKMLQMQHLELASHRASFADVAACGRSLEGFTDQRRWLALAALQQKYFEILDAHGLWDRPTARNFAMEHGECTFDGELVLFGLVDMSRTLRGMLEQIADRVTSLVYADTRLATRFDEYGCLRAEPWQAASLAVKDHQMLIADGPANQADAVVHALDSLEQKYAAQDISLGVPDVALVPHLENKLDQSGLHARWGPGRSVSGSRPVQWLRIVAAYLLHNRYEFFAELLRHSDTDSFLRERGHHRDGVRELDRFFLRHLPAVVDEEVSPDQMPPDSVIMVLDLLRPLRGPARFPAAWGEAILQVLTELYEHRQLRVDSPTDRVTLHVYEEIQSITAGFAELPATLTPRVTASTAILMLLSQIDEESVPVSADADALEMIGWLDLPLDDAKVAIVTSMNDGVVPRAVRSDAFLPNALRQALGFDDNAQRYARDAYALHVLLESKLAVRLIVGRRQANNDPLRPSRLLLALPKDQLADRCLRLFNSSTDCAPVMQPVPPSPTGFRVPRPRPLRQPINSLSVSDFASYLRCPYRFYLQKVMRLRSHHDRLSELDPPTFGELAHEVLEAFGKSDVRDSCEESEIGLYLVEQLARTAHLRFGDRAQPTVQVQLAQLKQRLLAFAAQQASWRLEGWRILCSESSQQGQLLVDGQAMPLVGRIDRIDHREIDGSEEFALLDYKTGDGGDTPEKKHLRKDRSAREVTSESWLDLQLPLYRHLLCAIEQIQEASPLCLGYVLLPSTPSDSRFALAKWTAEELQTADEAAADIVRKIRGEQFWPPTEPYPYAQHDEFAAIVQHGVFARESLGKESISA